MHQTENGSSNNSVMHLNASDDRGIDVIRNQINTFVSSMSLFETGLKFVILDEADYMTKPAQNALKSVLHKYGAKVRICIICNYINKIDSGLLSEFVSFKFNNIPKEKVFTLLSNIVLKENINLSESDIRNIQVLYSSDIRSMINCIQTFQYISRSNESISIITPELLEHIYTMIENKHPIKPIINVIMNTTHDPKDVIYHLFNLIIRKKTDKITRDLLDIMSSVLHFPECPLHCFINYVITQLYTKI
jgi:replication factor C subunit 3/5